MRSSNAQYTEKITNVNELIAAILNGEAAAYEQVVRSYNDYLYKIGRSYGFNHSDTEDLMQETYINAYTNLAQFQHRAAFKTWLTRIMLNECFHKKNKRQNKTEQVPPNVDPENKNQVMFTNHNDDTGKRTDNDELNQLLEKAILNIPQKYRLVFTLRELNGLSVKETSKALNLTISNVKVRLHRGKEMLQSELLKFYNPEDIFEFNLIYCDDMVEQVMAAIESKTPRIG